MTRALCDRADYSTFPDAVYLNQASLGLLGRPAVDAMHTFIDAVARHGNTYMSDEDEVAYADTLRVRAAELMHCDARRVAIVGSASEILGQLPLLLPAKKGRTILAVSTDFPAITRPWLRHAALTGHTVRFVEDQPDRDLTDVLSDAVDEDTAVVIVGSVQYATGTVVDIARLRRVTAAAGTRLIVDATQAAGALRVDGAAWDADAVVASGYKWLGGHGGVAIALLSEAVLEETPPLPGWMGAREPFAFDATAVSLAPDARRYTQSTMAYASMASLTASLAQLLAWGEARIEAHARALAATLTAGARACGWRPFREIGDPAASPHIVSLAREGDGVSEVVARLREHRIVCGTRGGRIRVSLAPYNDANDVQALLDVLARV